MGPALCILHGSAPHGKEEMRLLHIVWSVVVGFFVGLIARAVLPGADHMGALATTCVGIVGSVLGGLIARVFHKPEPGAMFHTAGFFMSIVGAVILLLILRWVK